jgi:ADP-ribose pyrophosphatase YjhB (NUDIX family)
LSSSRLYPDRPFLAASVAVIRDGRVLLAARANPPAAHVFSLPGGVVEAGETLAEAALRELREEVGVEAEILGFLSPVEIIQRDAAGRVERHFVVCAHVARWTGGEPQIGAEALEVRWLAPEDLARLDGDPSFRTTPGLIPILSAAFALAAESGL